MTLFLPQIGLGLVMLIHPGNPEQKVHTDSTRKVPENVQFYTVIYDLIMYRIPLVLPLLIDIAFQKSFS